ncbi:MAG: DEAD/DEAH box helicase family protein [Treponemataceae bacterium]|nr:MAG: DEAD/DEAH box helicase family protein [Treponemataceae bacterium]
MSVHSGFLREKEDFQRLILEHLRDDNGYQIRSAKTDFNAGLAMDTELLFSFLHSTQKAALEKLEKTYKEKTQTTVLNFINNEIIKKNRGLLDVLKNGVDFGSGVKLDLMYRQPAVSFNAKLNELYRQNILSVMEEVYHKENERVDLVIFLNGLALFAFELKCNTTGQSVEDAIRQFKTGRDYSTRLFIKKSGVLVSFAMDLKEVYMCTHLKGPSSFFLPFNKGNGEGIETGKGNPHNEDGINVSYMWEDILAKDTVLYLLDNFIFIHKETKKDSDTGKNKTEEKIIFPRYHQLNAVRRLTNDIRQHRTEKNYLIQHSAGSGKTNTIAWLAHRLVSLHDADEKEIFKTIIIITDRIVVDRQLQDAVLSIEHKEGLIKVMDDSCTSKDLAAALNGNTKIIVSTIQKFGHVLDSVKDLSHNTFAIIIDEAHSSTSGANMGDVSEVLSKGAGTGQSIDEDGDDNEEKTDFEKIEERITKEIAASGKQQNVSMIAFTATPKATTLQLFGTLNDKGQKTAFDNYSMKQAIEEGFILDVLQNYITYEVYYRINKAIEDDPELKTITAKRKIANYVTLHDTNIAQKIEIIVEHFRNNIAKFLDGRAKAMVVTPSRAAAVKYKIAFDNYIAAHNYDDIKALIAFSGKVTVENREYEEEKMNGFPLAVLRNEFDKDEYQVLLVANKYQTGFDQPKLCAMYVDKKLKGVGAVQILSRLNRIYPPYDKKTFILDFKNSYEDIQKAFAPYYTWTILKNTITPSDIRKVTAQIDRYGFLDYDDVNTFNDYLYQEKRTSREQEKMEALLDKALRLIYKHPVEEQYEIRSSIRGFLRFYCFLIQATSFEDIDLHKKYNFLLYLIKEIEITSGGNDFDIADKITVTFQKPKKTGEITAPDWAAEPEIEYPVPGEVIIGPDERKRLSKIIEEINAAYDKHFDTDVVTKAALQVKDILMKDERLRASAKTNTLKDFHFTYNDSVDDALVDGYDQNEEFYSLLLNNDELKKRVMHVFVEDVYTSLKG